MEVDSHPTLLDGDSCGTGRKREGKGLLSAEEEELLLLLLLQWPLFRREVSFAPTGSCSPRASWDSSQQ
jgi:hypothetical protein